MGHAGEDAGDSTAAEMLKASDRLPIASVMAPVAIGPSVCPTPKEIVHMAIALGQVAGGGVGVLKTLERLPLGPVVLFHIQKVQPQSKKSHCGQRFTALSRLT